MWELFVGKRNGGENRFSFFVLVGRKERAASKGPRLTLLDRLSPLHAGRRRVTCEPSLPVACRHFGVMIVLGSQLRNQRRRMNHAFSEVDAGRVLKSGLSTYFCISFRPS